MEDERIQKLLIALSLRSNLSDNQMLAMMYALKTDEQKWQMVLWMRRMMGKNLDQPIEFTEIWDQVEKIKTEITED